MQNRFLRLSALLMSLAMLLSLCLVDASAQSRRKRRSRRTKPAAARPVVTNPNIAAPGSEQAAGDTEKVISTADENQTETEPVTESPKPKKTTGKKTSSDGDMQQTINQLSNQVNRLSDKLSQIQDNDRTLIDMERLTRAEQRAESLRAQQVDVESKLADLQSKQEQIDYQLRPENIERAAGYGTLHPEDARDARRRQLEGERARALAQIKILETSRTRLETSVETADTEVDTLRRKIEAQQVQQDTSNPEPQPAKRPKPE